MKVLVAIPYFAPAYAFGGSVTVARTTVEGLLDAGHEVVVVTTDVLDARRRMAADAPVEPEGARVVRFANVSHAAAARSNVYLPRGLGPWLARHAPAFDVALLQDVYSAVSVLTARACARAGVPYVLQAHGTLSPARERGRPLAKRAFLAAWGRRTLAEAAALLCITERERADHLAAGADPARIVPMPLPLDPIAAAGVERAGVPTIAFLGRLHPIKRIDVLIEALARLRPDVPDVRLEIAGPPTRHGAQLEALARRLGVAGAVTFRGYVGGQEKARLLASAHASALLSAGEGLPVAALEAMACGTPVVLSHECHFPEVDGRAGFVVRADAGEAATALRRLLLDAEEHARLARGARALAADFRSDTVLPQFVAALESAAARGCARRSARLTRAASS